jgi:small conductance mechanosensitive channel
LVSYSEDFEKVKKIISTIASSNPLVLKDPAPFVRIGEYTDHAVSITTRLWVASGDFWTVRFDMLESVKEEFDKEGIEIPFNQLDVHVKSSPNEKLPRV